MAKKKPELTLQEQLVKLKKKKKKIRKEKEELIFNDLMDQLEAQGKHSEYYKDLVREYVKYWHLNNDLQDDIEIYGLRISRTTGNGFITDKPNESIERSLKVNNQMLKILNDLSLQIPQVVDDEDGY